MARPRKQGPDGTAGTMRQKRKNGDVYVYQRQSVYDPEKGYSVNKGYKLIGKYIQGEGDLVPTRPKAKAKDKQTPSEEGGKKQVGATDLLEIVGRDSGIDADLDDVFDESASQKILTIVRYWMLNRGETLTSLRRWQIMHPCPYPYDINRDSYHDLFARLGSSEALIWRYFIRRSERCSKKTAIAYDSTTVSTYSEQIESSRYGYNKDNDGLETVKFALLYAIENGQPIAFEKQQGNLPDVSCIENALKRLDALGFTNLEVVTDNGYYSAANVARFVRDHRKFLTLADLDAAWIKKEWEKIIEAGGPVEICPFDPDITGASVSLMHEVSWVRQKSRGEAQAGQKESKQTRLYLHFFMSGFRWQRARFRLNKELTSLCRDIEEGQVDFPKAKQKKIDRFIEVKRRGEVIETKIKMDEVLKETQHFGYFVLLSNKASTAFEALKLYRLREKIEEVFRYGKSDLDMDCTRVWSDQTLYGRMFVQNVTLAYWCQLKRIISLMKTVVAAPSPEIKHPQLKTWQDLKKWMDSHTIEEMVEWFDCLELTKLRTEGKTIQIRSQNTSRDQLFIDLFDQCSRKLAIPKVRSVLANKRQDPEK